MSFFFAKCAYGNHRIAMGYCRLSFYHLIVSSPIRCPIPDGIVFLYLLITQLFYGWLLLSDAYGITPAIRILIFLNRRALSLRISPSAWAGWFFKQDVVKIFHTIDRGRGILHYTTFWPVGRTCFHSAKLTSSSSSTFMQAWLCSRLHAVFFESLNLWIFDCTLSTICKIYIKE